MLSKLKQYFQKGTDAANAPEDLTEAGRGFCTDEAENEGKHQGVWWRETTTPSPEGEEGVGRETYSNNIWPWQDTRILQPGIWNDRLGQLDDTRSRPELCYSCGHVGHPRRDCPVGVTKEHQVTSPKTTLRMERRKKESTADGNGDVRPLDNLGKRLAQKMVPTVRVEPNIMSHNQESSNAWRPGGPVNGCPRGSTKQHQRDGRRREGRNKRKRERMKKARAESRTYKTQHIHRTPQFGVVL